MPLGAGAALALGAGSSLFSGGISGLADAFSSRRANKRMVDFWNMQNEYNHPAAQRARLEEAGFNPAMMYGQSASGVAGNAGDVGRPERAKFQMDNPMNQLHRFADVGVKNAQIDNVKAQTTVNLEQAALISAKTASEILNKHGKNLDNTLKREILQTSVDAKKETTRQLELQTIGLQIDNMVKSRTAASIIKRHFYQAASAAENVRYIKSGTRLRELETQLKKEGLENSPFWARWIFRNIGPMVEDKFNQFKN